MVKWYRKNKDDGNLYYFEGNGEREGYALVHLGPEGRNITNMQGATGQFAHYNGRNVTLTDAGIIDRGPYVAPPQELPDGSEWAGNMLLQFMGVSVVGGFILPEASGGLMLLNATAATLELLKEQDSNIVASVEADRQAGVRAAWQQETELVRRTGRGTVNWTPQEMEELLRTGRVSGYEGHHSNSVNGHPEMARDPSNVRFVRGRAEHLSEHGGNFRNPTEGPLVERVVPKP